MVSFEKKLKSFGVSLYRINAIKFGEFETKSGLLTPVYLDLRVIVSYPKLLDTLADLIDEHIQEEENFDIICGVPYTALPIATVVSLKKNLPMVTRRKEKFSGARMIEGQFNKDANCLIIEDVVTSGSSVLETAKDLESYGINCKHAVVLLNREQGGRKILQENGVKMHALLNLKQLMKYLKEAGCIDETIVQTVDTYLKKTQVSQKLPSEFSKNRLTLPFSERAKLTKNPIARKLFETMETKQSNLCVSIIVTNFETFCDLLHKIGPHICLLITFVEAISDTNPENVKNSLLEAAAKYNFLICEDKKFADIGKTVQLQYSNCLYKTSSWAHAVTAHSLMGKGILNAIKDSDGLTERGVFLIAETVSAGNLMDMNYIKETTKLAEEYPDLVTGIDCRSRLMLDHPGFIQLTHEVQLNFDNKTTNVCSDLIDDLVLHNGADIVAGKPITDHCRVLYKQSSYTQNLKLVKENLWESYLKRLTLY